MKKNIILGSIFFLFTSGCYPVHFRPLVENGHFDGRYAAVDGDARLDVLWQQLAQLPLLDACRTIEAFFKEVELPFLSERLMSFLIDSLRRRESPPRLDSYLYVKYGVDVVVAIMESGRYCESVLSVENCLSITMAIGDYVHVEESPARLFFKFLSAAMTEYPGNDWQMAIYYAFGNMSDRYIFNYCLAYPRKFHGYYPTTWIERCKKEEWRRSDLPKTADKGCQTEINAMLLTFA